jgi:hypothetical protein
VVRACGDRLGRLTPAERPGVDGRQSSFAATRAHLPSGHHSTPLRLAFAPRKTSATQAAESQLRTT